MADASLPNHPPALLDRAAPWWSWSRTIWALIVAVLAVVGYFYIDRPLTEWTNDIPRPVNIFCSYLTMAAAAEWLLIPLVVIYILALICRHRFAIEASFLAFVSVLASGLLVNIIKVLAARYRPGMLKKELYGFDFFHFGFDYNSFPSGHATAAAAVAAAVWLAFPRWRVPAVVVAAVLASTRVIIRAHFFSDVIVGAFVGVIVTLWMRNVLARTGVPTFKRIADDRR